MRSTKLSDKMIIEFAGLLGLTCEIDKNGKDKNSIFGKLYTVKKEGIVVSHFCNTSQIHSWLLGYMRAKEIYQTK